MEIKFCEFTGDDEKYFDEVPFSERVCEHAGFGFCTLHKESLGEKDGWRTCCAKCETPKQIKRFL